MNDFLFLFMALLAGASVAVSLVVLVWCVYRARYGKRDVRG